MNIIDKYLISENKNGYIYFGHPGPTYNTKYEKDGIERIKEEFPGYDIINPNQASTQSKYKKQGFDIFYNFIDKSDFCVFMTMPDGKWGVGIYEEAYYCFKSGKKSYELNPISGEITLIPDPTKKKYYEIGLIKKGKIKRRIK
jgi:hypothetical protein